MMIVNKLQKLFKIRQFGQEVSWLHVIRNFFGIRQLIYSRSYKDGSSEIVIPSKSDIGLELIAKHCNSTWINLFPNSFLDAFKEPLCWFTHYQRCFARTSLDEGSEASNIRHDDFPICYGTSGVLREKNCYMRINFEQLTMLVTMNNLSSFNLLTYVQILDNFTDSTCVS